VQDKAQGLLKAGDPDGAAELLAEEAVKSAAIRCSTSTPARRSRPRAWRTSPRATSRAASTRPSVGLDILHFLQDPRCDPEWQIVDGNEVQRGDPPRREAHRGQREGDRRARHQGRGPATPAPTRTRARKKAPRDGRGFIAAGSVLTLVGIGGLGMMGAGLATGASAQKDIDALADNLKNGADRPGHLRQREDLEIDSKGERGNVLTYAGIGVGAVGLAAGIALLVVGVKKRKKYRAEHGGASDSPSALLLPAVGRGSAGLVLSGRF
jgi:hypothetical protein